MLRSQSNENPVGGADYAPELTQPAAAEPTTTTMAAVPVPVAESEQATRRLPAPGGTRGPSGVLGVTGSATRTLLMLAGVALLLGALAVAFGGSLTPAAARAPQRTVAADWGPTVPLAPGKRQRARRRAGITNPGAGPSA